MKEDESDDDVVAVGVPVVVEVAKIEGGSDVVGKIDPELVVEGVCATEKTGDGV